MEPTDDGRHMVTIPVCLDELRGKGVVVRDVSCGVKHTAVLTSGSMKIICFGSN